MKYAFLTVLMLTLTAQTQTWISGKVYKKRSKSKHPISYHVHIPNTFKKDSPPPVLILFSPNGRGLDMLNHFKSSTNKMGWIVVACDTLRNGMDPKIEGTMENDAFESIIQTIPHSRIYLGGFSGGAQRSYRLSWKYKTSNIAGIVALGGWLGGPKTFGSDYKDNMAIAIINGNNDKNANAWVKPDTQVLEKHNCTVKVFQFPGAHQVAPHNTLLSSLSWLEKAWLKKTKEVPKKMKKR